MTPQWAEVAMKVSSSTETNTYGWLGHFPKLQEWVGKRRLRKMQAQGMQVTNKLLKVPWQFHVPILKMIRWDYLVRW
ncbi:Mu-like prophage major head subunit gpT [Rodentibacter pneumotropicus]|uniref:Mu-like prophage major head subunit gpT n=1 Tax=Rodentibacter pneumotropicus TaxID=758 RepID=A0A448MPS2_9PAST|nr:Mu-like prophage major head subunit gpT [Rodentibacter pneumotropicus]